MGSSQHAGSIEGPGLCHLHASHPLGLDICVWMKLKGSAAQAPSLGFCYSLHFTLCSNHNESSVQLLFLQASVLWHTQCPLPGLLSLPELQGKSCGPSEPRFGSSPRGPLLNQGAECSAPLPCPQCPVPSAVAPSTETAWTASASDRNEFLRPFHSASPEPSGDKHRARTQGTPADSSFRPTGHTPACGI